MKRTYTACFSGYCPEKFALIMERGDTEYLPLEARIEAAILQAADDGYTRFLCGMAKGFDLVAGSIVVALKESWAELAGLELVAVLPFAGHGYSNHPWRVLHDTVLSAAAEVTTLSPHDHDLVIHERNRYMVDHSSRLICHDDSHQGRCSHHIVKYAAEQGLTIVNVV